MSEPASRATRSYGMYRMGSAAAVLLATLFVMIGVTYLFLPAGMKVVGTGDPAVYYRAMVDHPGPIFTLEWETVPLGLLGLAVVLGLTAFVRTDRTEGWLAYTAVLAGFGFLLKTLDSLRGTALHELRAQAWLDGDTSTRAAIGATRLTLDYLGWFAFGAVGLWAMTVSVTALRRRLWAPWISVAGVAFGIGFMLLMVGEITVFEPLLDVCVAVAAPAGVIWFLAVGGVLWRASRRFRAGADSSPGSTVTAMASTDGGRR